MIRFIRTDNGRAQHMQVDVIHDLALILFLGILAQWLSWRLRLPSILLLLGFGFLAGPVLQLLHPDDLFKELLFPFVSLSVGVILFEGGLTLRFSQIREVRRTVRNLISIGAGTTWILSSAAAFWILGLGYAVSILLGAILVVTGPTVVIPLLRHIQPIQRLGSVARWEGILIDPIGATLAVLVFEAVLIGGWREGFGHALLGLMQTLLIGGLAGGLGALLLVYLLRYYLVPDYLHTSMTLMIVLVSFALANQMQEESGLLAATLMGIVLANQKAVVVRHIAVFKETLTVLLISSLFILLAARVSPADFGWVDGESLLFVCLLILVIRPVSVFLATLGTRLAWRERCFLAFLAPRGIVAAAVASIFSLRLERAGLADSERIVPVTFLAIVVTVAVYGLGAKPLAQFLGLANTQPQGFLIVGAHDWSLKISRRLEELGYQVLIIDRNRDKVTQARLVGLNALQGNASREDGEDLELSGLGRLLALTANDEANSLACLNFREIFSRAEVYQLAPRPETRSEPVPHLRGRLLFDETATFESLQSRFRAGAEIKVTKLTDEFDAEDYRELYGPRATPLFFILPNGHIQVAATDQPPGLKTGRTIVSIIDPEAEHSAA